MALETPPPQGVHPPPPPAANAHKVKKVYRAGRPSRPSVLPPISSLPPFRSPPAALRNHVWRTHPHPAPVIPSGPASRSPSAASAPIAHTPPAPCTPAASPKDVHAILPR